MAYNEQPEGAAATQKSEGGISPQQLQVAMLAAKMLAGGVPASQTSTAKESQPNIAPMELFGGIMPGSQASMPQQSSQQMPSIMRR